MNNPENKPPFDIEEIFLDSLLNAIETGYDLKPGMAIAKQGSRDLKNGQKIKVYSDDHDTHFHIVHKSSGVNGRFSFPSMELESYVSKNKYFNQKQLKNIKITCSIESNKRFIYEQLIKRGTPVDKPTGI